MKERQDEKFRYADRQALLYREENEKINNELNQTRVGNLDILSIRKWDSLGTSSSSGRTLS
jgi:hypothetical protein